MQHLLSPIELGSITCRNRVAMAPCTRCMSPDFMPTDDVAAYYERRAQDGVGLLISEGTVISERANGYNGAPGIFNAEQVTAWKKVTNRVHDAGGAIACQIWHVGAVAHQRTTGGEMPESPSGLSPDGYVSRLTNEDGSKIPFSMSEPMSEARIREVIALYADAASRSIEAGFDGVEIHGAHGYLIDQFLNLHWNRRDDDWGGEQRFRFAAKVAKAVVAAVGADRAWMRISPVMSVAQKPWVRPEETFAELLKHLWDAGLRILHGSNLDYDQPILSPACLSDSQREGLSESPITLHTALRRAWSGQIIGVGDLTPARANDAIEQNEIDMAAFGRSLIANWNFISRVRDGVDLQEYEPRMLETLH